MVKQAECHPDRKNHARGLCSACARAAWTRAPRQRVVPECHPERPHKAKGLCLSCYRKYDPAAPRGKRPNRRLSAHGLKPAQYDALCDEQEGVCAICRQAPGERERVLAIDHDHTTGDVRGLLCTRCNLGLGGFRDDPSLLAQAISYLMRPPTGLVSRLAQPSATERRRKLRVVS